MAVCRDIRFVVLKDLHCLHVPFACFFETIFAHQLRTGKQTLSFQVLLKRAVQCSTTVFDLRCMHFAILQFTW